MSEERTVIVTVKMRVLPEMSDVEAVNKLFTIIEVYSVTLEDIIK